jgi:hypothetical protein
VPEFMKSKVDSTQKRYPTLLYEREIPDNGASEHAGDVPPQRLP